MKKILNGFILLFFIALAVSMLFQFAKLVWGFPNLSGSSGNNSISSDFSPAAGGSYIKNPDNILVLVNKSNHLSPDYIPKDLVELDIPFSSNAYPEEKMMRNAAAQAFLNLFKQAKNNGINLIGVSGYRSYKLQQETYDENEITKGTDYAENYVADPGQSEHQTGLAIDVGAQKTTNPDFGKSKEGIWLKNNAYKYGFILRYPENKEDITGYNYEPWHLRYVGKSAAKIIYTKGLVLEEYIDEYLSK